MRAKLPGEEASFLVVFIGNRYDSGDHLGMKRMHEPGRTRAPSPECPDRGLRARALTGGFRTMGVVGSNLSYAVRRRQRIWLTTFSTNESRFTHHAIITMMMMMRQRWEMNIVRTKVTQPPNFFADSHS